MSTSLNEYQKKRALLEQLQSELQAIEEDPKFSEQLRFVEEINAVLTKYNKPADALAALLPPSTREKLSSASSAPSGRTRRARKPSRTRIFEHPETGERVEAKSMNHKTIRRWVQEHGKDTVEGWVVETLPQA